MHVSETASPRGKRCHSGPTPSAGGQRKHVAAASIAPPQKAQAQRRPCTPDLSALGYVRGFFPACSHHRDLQEYCHRLKTLCRMCYASADGEEVLLRFTAPSEPAVVTPCATAGSEDADQDSLMPKPADGRSIV